jgi:hypothetical protein
MSNRNYPKIVTATTVIPFDNPVTAIPQKTITGATTFTKTTTGAQAGYCAIIRVVADGSNVPDLSAFKSIGTGTWDNTSGVVNQLWFVFDGTEYCVAITHPGTIVGGGGGGDTTPPSTTSVTVENAEPNKVLIAYGETLDSGSVPATSAYTVKVNGTTRTTSAVSITGANVKVTFGGAAVVSTDSITLDYVVPGTSPIQDAAGNDAAALTAVTVGNNVAPAATVENLTLNSVGGVYTNSSQIFTVTAGGSSWHNDEKDAKHIAAGQDGYVQAQFATSDSLNCFLGFSTINAATDYDTNMNAALWILTGGVVGYRDHGGTGGDVLETNSGTTLSANQWVRVSRTGGVIKLQKVDTDGTTVLSDIYTFSFTSTGILYIVSDMNGAGKLSNPKGYNITT